MFVRSDDPARDADLYYADLESELAKRPKCSECGERIQAEEYYEFDGKFYCPDCLEKYHRRYTEDYLEADI